jgi:hypothetical protein
MALEHPEHLELQLQPCLVLFSRAGHIALEHPEHLETLPCAVFKGWTWPLSILNIWKPCLVLFSIKKGKNKTLIKPCIYGNVQFGLERGLVKPVK